MTKYVLAFRSPKNYTPGGDETMAQWQSFFEGLAGHIVDPGNPVYSRTSVGDCGSDVNPLGGYTVIQTNNIEAAATLAKGCPFLAIGGGVEVGEITELM